LGAWFGFIALPQIILIAAVTSIVVSVIGMIFKTRDKDTPLAFGPFLAIGGWATLFLGNNIF
ncbi:MAG: prepilin peptidase, partial [Thiomicrorhabdus sp.]|nr:prepilin peptidase [Thiomicrorhabdus sp.]